MKISKTYRLNGGTLALLQKLSDRNATFSRISFTSIIERAVYNMACDILGDVETEKIYVAARIKEEA